MDGKIFFEQTETVNTIISIIEIFFIILYSFYTFIRFINVTNINIKIKMEIVLYAVIISILGQITRIYIDLYHSILFMLIMIIIVNSCIFKKEKFYSISMSIISFGLNEAIYTIAEIIAFFPNAILRIKNDYIGSATIIVIYSFLIFILFKVQKFKYGINYLQNKMKNSFYSLLIINISIMILFLKVIFPNTKVIQLREIFINMIIFFIYIIFFIKQAFDLQYKQNLLTKDLEQTKSELEEKKQEIDKLEKENLEFCKTSHSLAHKQKSLEYKLEQLMKTGVDTQSKEVIKQEIQNISKEVYKEPQRIELPKTEIESIDDMFSYMQFECIKDNIKFELQVVGNVFYMINHLISESELEILIADHIKDAIIAINHSDNTNRSILVRIGKINNVYSLYIYDSGIEFEREVLEKLGKKPITTHSDTGGTGMGFMNTFDTLNRTKASLIINEIGKPCIDNYTKVLIFKFDNKNEFIVNSYKNEVVVV